ncbi:hypothetical protein BU15DRAFT_64002 [Melanogaster broomeanus]|nr:hypothetical protein BU15DRAFT_64002 [Melanogaster broomeanus]
MTGRPPAGLKSAMPDKPKPYLGPKSAMSGQTYCHFGASNLLSARQTYEGASGGLADNVVELRWILLEDIMAAVFSQVARHVLLTCGIILEYHKVMSNPTMRQKHATMEPVLHNEWSNVVNRRSLNHVVIYERRWCHKTRSLSTGATKADLLSVGLDVRHIYAAYYSRHEPWTETSFLYRREIDHSTQNVAGGVPKYINGRTKTCFRTRWTGLWLTILLAIQLSGSPYDESLESLAFDPNTPRVHSVSCVQ